jgi:RPA family protein
MKRETAWRVFASEYNDCSLELKGEGEMTPSYVVSPLGAKINRLFLIGVLTDVERMSESGDLLRAHVSDPTGVFTLYSGQYQQGATDALLEVEVPTFVALSGKSRTYSPEEGTLFVSVRPEWIQEVDAAARDRWILETCERTMERIEAMREAQKMTEPKVFELEKLGYSRSLAEGITAALQHYDGVDFERYRSLLKESLQFLSPARRTLNELISSSVESTKDTSDQPPQKSIDERAEGDDFRKIEETVLQVIKDLQGDDGASWDDITATCEKAGVDSDAIEEALTSLMDKGLIYEPILGTIKVT